MSSIPALRSLDRRQPQLVERMDGPCDERALFATYRRFALVNRMVSGWQLLYRDRVRPALRAALGRGQQPRLLDLGFGGGDIPRSLLRWARADNIPVQVVAADPDPRAGRFVRGADRGSGVQYLTASSGDLAGSGEVFDVVVSNHLLHHLDHDAFTAVLADSRRLGRALVLHADIARSRTAYGLYAIGSALLAPGCYVREDGLLSIRRSYTVPELQRLAPDWQVTAYAPFRLALEWSVQRPAPPAAP